MAQKVGLVIEGGGMRGIYTAGILDYLMEQNISFDYVVGVSAGSGNASSYVSGQIGRTKKIILHENAPSYYGASSLLRTGKFLNLNTLVTRYANRDIPFDYDSFFASSADCEFVAVCCETGKAEYLSTRSDRDYFCKACIASCSVPFLCKPVEIEGKHYLDGSIVDSIPAKRAMDMGCDKVLIVLTKPEGGGPTDYNKYKKLIGLQYKKYPLLGQALLDRVKEYDKQKAYLDQLVAQGKAMIIRPEVQLMHHFETDVKKMDGVYQTAYASMESWYPKVRTFVGE